jgi:lipoyl-dependent peroxiredoxin
MIRQATAVWNGSGKEGSGHLTTKSQVLKETSYSFSSRFENGEGTNPEELIAAAHAGCFTMKLSFILGEAGFTPQSLETTCEITFESGTVSKSHLSTKGKVPGIDKDKFDECVERASKECPISKLLNTSISAEGTLS